MEKQTVFIKRYPSKGEFPKVSKKYFTNYGYSDYSVKTNEWCDEDWLELDVEWWLEEIELPSEDDIELQVYNESSDEESNDFNGGLDVGYNRCYQLILNKLKGETKQCPTSQCVKTTSVHQESLVIGT